jgi:RNA-directed DNA polymerase
MERRVVSASGSPPVPVPIRLSAVWRAWVRARARRGSHSAVDRLQAFMRQRENMPGATVAGGWYLQLDVHNFFNSIHRPTLYTLLCHRLAQAQKRGQLPAAHALALRSLCHKLLARRVTEQVRNPAAAAGLPPHKRLCNAAPGCGLPVGNLTSQFFANVYLNALDQFVKHTLKVRHYVRYVDDFVLLGDSPAQLQHWQGQIAAFLHETLHLRLRDAAPLRPCRQGVDFLGYVVFTHHRRVRQRVVQHCRAKLQRWHQQHQSFERVRPAQVQQLQALLGSYWGHFAHANSVCLRHQIFSQMPWLTPFFDLNPDGSLHLNTHARWQVLRRRAVKRILKPEGENL